MRYVPVSTRLLAVLLSTALVPAAIIPEERAVQAVSSTDWNRGTVHSVVTLDAVKEGIGLPAGRSSALQILEMETPARLKDTLFSIPVDSSNRLGHYVDRGEISLAEINGIIENGTWTPPWMSQDLAGVSMTVSLELSRFGSLFVRHNGAWRPRAPLDSVPTRPYTGIVIDARGSLPVHGEYTEARIAPCLFPRVWNEDMDSLYERNMVDPDIARKRGIVVYASLPEDPAVVRTVGSDPARITARRLFGTNRTDPLVSRQDYLRIMSSPENRSLFAAGKVAILCDPDRLTGIPLGPVKDDEYYFTFNRVKRALQAQPVAKMDFSDAWEGQKMTIYDVKFIADSARILPEERSRLDSIANALKQASDGATFIVEGHTANVGKPGGERALSIERAALIAAELSARGIDAKRFTSTGYGGTRPVATNETDEGRAKNRRVEITIRLRHAE